MRIHDMRLGDHLTPYGFKLQQRNEDGVLASRDVTGATVKVELRRATGDAVVIAETETGVTITDAATGEGHYDFPTTLDDAAPWAVGRYHLRVLVYGGTARDSHPVKPEALIQVFA